MEIHLDIKEARPLIEACIKKFGYAPEHNYDHYTLYAAEYEAAAFVSFSDGAGLLCRKNPDEWNVFSEPLAPPDRRAAIVSEFITDALKDEAIKKVSLELYIDTRRELQNILPSSLRARRISYSLTWPVFDLDVFDPLLPGGHYKELRNARNKFYREHRVEVLDAKRISKEDLSALIGRWLKARPSRDRAYPEYFYAAVDKGFPGITSARAVMADGKLVGLNAGFSIPNSQGYYAAIGLHDYSISDLGDMLNLEDLTYLKSAGYKEADFGGSWQGMIPFKLKLGKARLYESFIFSVVRK